MTMTKVDFIVVHLIRFSLDWLLTLVYFCSEHDRLFFLVYERVELVNQSSIQPHLWTYRSRITLEHLAQTLQERKMKERHPILYEFLQAVSDVMVERYRVDRLRSNDAPHTL